MYVSLSIMWGKYTRKSTDKVGATDRYGRHIRKHITWVGIKVETKRRPYIVVA